MGRAVQHDPALRDRALAAAHPGHLRGRRRARLRPSVRGAAVPALDRHGRHLGSRVGGGRRRGDAPRAARHRLATGTSRRFRTCPRQPVGPLLRDLGRAARARSSAGRRQRARHAGRRLDSRRSRRRSSTSPATRSRSTGTTGSRPSCRSATCRTSSCRRTRAASTPARRRSWWTPARSTTCRPPRRTSC